MKRTHRLVLGLVLILGAAAGIGAKDTIAQFCCGNPEPCPSPICPSPGQ